MKQALKYYIHELKARVLGIELKSFAAFTSFFADRKGLEIGGPSKIFGPGNYLPVYSIAGMIDGVNFSDKTVWEGAISRGASYRYIKGKTGQQFICEGNELGHIPDASYDFVLSSHNLEHFANPLKAVDHWHRILKPGGVLLMVLPDKRYTFDHRRSVTTLAHLLEDYNSNTPESDLTHLEEIISLHDLSKDPGIKGRDAFIGRSKNNVDNRCLHQHVFDTALLQQILQQFGMKCLYTDTVYPYHIIVMGQKQGRAL